MDVDELAPDMGHAGDLADGARAVKVLEPGISVCMHPAAELGEMVLGMLALPITREAIPGGGWCSAAPRPFVARIGPEPCRLGLAGSGGEHADRRVVGEDRLGRQDMAAYGICEGFQQGRGFAHPIGQGRSVEVETFAVEDLALAVERQVIGVFANQDMGQQAWPWAAALDGARRKRCLDEALAAGAGQSGPDDPVHDEAAWDILEFFGDVFADPAQAAAALGTGVRAGRQLDFHPRDMIRDRAALGFVILLDVRQFHPCCHRGGGDLAGLEGQLQLFRRLGRGPEPMRPMTC